MSAVVLELASIHPPLEITSYLTTESVIELKPGAGEYILWGL